MLNKNSSNLAIDRCLKSCPHYIGTFGADSLPDPATVKPGSGLIVNTLAQGHAGVGHWLGIVSPDPSRGKELAFFDSYGFPPDGTNAIMGVTTHFGKWCKRSSELAGQGGRYRTNNVEIECEASTVCGNLSAYFVLHGLPARPDGSITPPWTQIVTVMRNSGCSIGDQLVRTLVPVK